MAKAMKAMKPMKAMKKPMKAMKAKTQGKAWQVLAETHVKTARGVTKGDLMKNKRGGKVVSKPFSEAPIQAVSSFRTWLSRKVCHFNDKKKKNVEVTKWAEGTLSSLHSISKIETLEVKMVCLVDTGNWASFSEKLIKKVCRNGATHAQQELRDNLSLVGDSKQAQQHMFDISLNYEFGGSQYMSCTKFVTYKVSCNQVVVAYSMFGKKWIEQREYALNRAFWESAPTPQKLKDFLDAGAGARLAEALENATQDGSLEDAWHS
jgi:hypothetical protein